MAEKDRKVLLKLCIAEVFEWFERAEVFLKEAESLLERGVYWFACFCAHQAAEFYLKGFLHVVTGSYPPVHDLVKLVHEVARVTSCEPPREVLRAAFLLTPHYSESRYPGTRPVTYDKSTAELCLESARLIISWVQQLLSKHRRDCSVEILRVTLHEFVKCVRERLGEVALLLFGSWAQGRARPTSDIDVLVVTQTGMTSASEKARIVAEVRECLPLDVSADIVVLSLEELVSDKVWLQELERGCVILYDGVGLRSVLAKCFSLNHCEE